METIGIDVKIFLDEFSKNNDLKKAIIDEVDRICAEKDATDEKPLRTGVMIGIMPRIIKDFCFQAIGEAITANNKKIYDDLKNKGII